MNNGTSNSAPATVSLGILAGLPVSYMWNSATSGNWSVAGNWASGAPAATGQPYYNLNFTPAGTYTVTHDLTDGFLLNQLNMAGAVTLAGSNGLAFTANGNVLPQFNQNSSSAVTVATPVSLAAMTTITGSGSGPVVLQGLLAGAGSLTVNTLGMVQLYGLSPNTFSGGTVINSGTLHLGAIINGISPPCTGVLGTGSVTLNGGTLEFDYVTTANALILNGGTLYCNNGWGAVCNGPVSLNATATVNTSYNITLNGNIAGVGGFTKTGANTLYLSGTNTFTGTNSITGGTLSCSKAAALGSGPLNISSGAKVTLNFTGTRTISSLSLGGSAMPAGTYGSTASTATNKNDSYFSGTGTLSAGSPNSAPVASAQSVGTAENTAKPITLIATDAEGNPFTYAILTQPAHGTLSGTAPYVTYAPMLNYYGTDGFTFKVNDGSLDSAPATISITVTRVNAAPVATIQRVTTATNTAMAITLAGTDAEGSALTYAIVTQPAHGSLSGSPPNLTYLPAAGFSGGDSFTFKVNDGTLDSAPATVLITVMSASQTFGIGAQTSAQSAGSVTINLTPEFLTSVNLSSKRGVMTAGRGSGGSAWGKSLSGITYGTTNLLPAINVRSNDVKPTAGGEEVAGIFYLDNPGATPATTVTISYAGVMDTSSGYTLLALSGSAPGVSAANGGVTPGVVTSGSTTLTTVAANSLVLAVGAADRATPTPLAPFSTLYTYASGTYGAGALSVATPGMVTPTFNYSSAETTPVTVAAAFVPGDTIPPTTAGSAIVDDKNGGPVAINTLVTYTVSFSEEMDAGTVSAADFGNAGTAAISIGTVSAIAPGVFTVPVTPTSTGTLQLQIKAGAVLTDVAGNALVTTSAIVDDTLISVTPPNTAPVAIAQSVTTVQNTPMSIPLAATDAEGDALTVAIIFQPAHGTLGGTAPNVTYTPAAGYFGTDSFTFKANDGTLDSAPATVNIAVMLAFTTALVLSPVASGPYGTTLTFTASVTAGATGTVTFMDGMTVLGSAAVDGVSGQASYATSTLAVASHSLTASYGGDATYAGSVSAPRAYGVSPLALTLSGVTATAKIYDGNNAAVLTGGALAGVISGESVTVVPGSGSFASPNAGSRAVTASGYLLAGASAGNYVLAAQPSVPNATISPRPLQLIGNGTRTYDATAGVAAAGLAIANKLSGDDVLLTGSALLDGKDAGTRGVLSGFLTPLRVGSATGNTGSSASTTVTVNLTTVPVSGNTLIAVVATRGSSASRVSGISGGGVTWSRVSQAANASGITTEIWHGPNVTSGSTVITIGQASLVSAAVVMEYSGLSTAAAIDLAANSTGTNTAALTGSTGTTNQANELWIGGIGIADGRRTLNAPYGNSFTLVASPKSGSAAGDAMIYALEKFVSATAAASSSGTLSASDSWSGAIATFKAAPLQNLALAGTSAANYTLTGATAAVNITPKPLTLSATPAVASKTYNGLVAAALTGSALRSAEAAGTGTTADATPYTSDAVAVMLSGTFDTRNAGTGKAVTSTSSLSGAQKDNYTLIQPTGLTGNVTPLPLTVAAVSAAKTYDGTTSAAGTPTLTPPLVAGDAATVLSQAFQDPDAGAGNKVIIPNIIIGDGNGGANYAVVLTSFTSGTIDKAPATVTLGNLAQPYDGRPKAASATTVPAGKAVDFTYDGSSTSPSAAGSYGVVATIADANFSGSATGTLVIAVAPLDAWRSAHFTAAEISAGLAADNTDADGDGFTNLAEYILGSDPRSFSPQPLAIASAPGNQFTLSFLARRAGGDAYAGLTRLYTVEGCATPANLTSWLPVSGFTNLVGATQTRDIVGDDQAVELTLPVTLSNYFYRLTVRLE